MSALSSFPAPFDAVVVGASGGIGRAFVEALAADPSVGRVLALARAFEDDAGGPGARIVRGRLDLTDEASIDAAARRLDGWTPRLVLVATGHLHGATGGPEKRLADLEPARLAHAFAINATGPMLVAKAFAPRLPREGKAVFAALSARVGSISDNRSGGWHGYRASKAALNMMLRTLAIELAARRPETIVAGLHPGTVDTALSAPFRSRVPGDKLFTPAFSAASLLTVVDRLTPADTGSVFDWAGARVPE